MGGGLFVYTYWQEIGYFWKCKILILPKFNQIYPNLCSCDTIYVGKLNSGPGRFGLTLLDSDIISLTFTTL